MSFKELQHPSGLSLHPLPPPVSPPPYGARATAFARRISMRWTRVLALFAALCCSTTALFAQTGPGRITGIVTESESAQPISDVSVTVTGTPFTARTGADGRFLISAIAPGRYQLHFARLGFAALSDSVVVTPGG